MRIAIVGAGISGLAAAYYVRKLIPDAQVTLFEASDRLGGVLRTERDGDYLVEHAADNFLRGPTAPWANELCQAMGFADNLIPTAEQNRGAHVVWGGQLIRVPAGFQLMAPSRFLPILGSPLLSWKGKLRLCCEPFIREPSDLDRDESLTEFATRRLGAEAFERLVQPLVSGIYTADPDVLSVRAALPQMVQMVAEHGSLYRAMRARQRSATTHPTNGGERGARYSLFIAPQGGMRQWIEAFEQPLRDVDVQQGVCIKSVKRQSDDVSGNNAWSIERDSGQPPAAGAGRSDLFDGVVLAVPTMRAAQMLQTHEETESLAQQLNAIPYAGSVVVALGYRRNQISRPLDAFGSVVPRHEGRPVLAFSYSSLKFPGRAPDDRVLIRSFLGGALQPQLVDEDDATLITYVQHELRELLGVTGTPELCRVIRWPNAMPQYQIGHLQRLSKIESRVAELPGLCLAGNGYRGVGIPQCVASGKRAAERLASLATKWHA